MGRILLVLAGFVLSACASAPPTPAQLIVGVWDCKLPSMAINTSQFIAFDANHALRLDYDGGEVSHGFSLKFKARMSGIYELEGEWLRPTFNSVQLDSVIIDGQAVEGQMLSRLEAGVMESANKSLASPIEILDGQRLVLRANDGSAPMSCVRVEDGRAKLESARQWEDA